MFRRERIERQKAEEAEEAARKAKSGESDAVSQRGLSVDADVAEVERKVREEARLKAEAVSGVGGSPLSDLIVVARGAGGSEGS